MPKATSWPVSGVFGLHKPTNMITMSMLNDLKELLATSPVFVAKPKPLAAATANNKKHKGKRHGKPNPQSTVKLGQGGTLDPLASGVLVIGLGEGTKQLKNFLDCTKTYRATGLLGCSTDSYDSQGKLVRRTKSRHLKSEDVEAVLDRFRGDITQMPPVYSALKMEGKPLYEYAREGKPLPRPIEPRSCTVSHLALVDWKDSAAHQWEFPTEEMEVEMVEKMESLVDAPKPDASATETKADEGPGPAFTIEMTVSSGTYVRSIVHDIGVALNSSAHVVTLERTRQGAFALESEGVESSASREVPEILKPCLEWSTVQKAIDTKKAEAESEGGDKVEQGKSEWEQAILAILQQSTAG